MPTEQLVVDYFRWRQEDATRNALNAHCYWLLRKEGDRTVFIVADGAGGISGGAQAADLFVRSVREGAAKLATAEDCYQLLQALDKKIAESTDCGETTGVVVVVQSDGLFGANVGDSAA